MEQIRLTIEQWCQMAGIDEQMAVFAADITLVMTALLLSWLAYAVCHHLVVPATVKLTEKTNA